MNSKTTKTVIHTTVFSDGENGGNPCPVVLDADGLSVQQGMSLAEKFGSETVFISTSHNSQTEFRLRYFVPLHEMEMCVHGTVGAVTVLHTLNKMTNLALTFETLLGPLHTECSVHDDRVIVTVDQFVPQFASQNPSPQQVAQALGLADTSLLHHELPIASVSTARHKLIVALKDVQVLDQLQPDFEALWALCDRYELTGLYPFAQPKGSQTYAARQFPKRAGYNEDPATGVAACALGAYLCHFLSHCEGWNSFEILQGQAMGRPSRLIAKALVENGAIRETSVMGEAKILRREHVPLDL